MMVKEGGFGALVALFLGVVGLIVAIGAGVTAVASRRAAFYVGIAALVLASLASGVGLLGMAMGWRNTQAAVAGATVDAVQRYRIVREGYFESQSSAKIGFGASVLPLLLGAAAALVGAGAKRAPAPAPQWRPPGGAPPKESSGGRWVAAGIAAAFALLTTGGALAATFTSPPKAKYEFEIEDSEAWDLASAREQVDTDAELGCDKLDQALDALWRSSDRRQWPRQFLRNPDTLVPDWRVAATTCVGKIWAHVKTDGEWTRSTASPGLYGFGSAPPKTWTPGALLDSPLLVDEALHTELLAAAAAAPMGRGAGIGLGTAGMGGRGNAGPRLRLGATSVNGRLPPEVIQRIVRQHLSGIRACYESALAKEPTLAGTVKVKFVIDRDGGVSSVSDGGSDLPDATVKSCVQGTFKAMSFPAPEGGIVTVTYPIVFEAGG